VTSNVHNFPLHTGLAIGLGKSTDGLSAGIFSQIYTGIFAPSAKPFLLMLPLTLFGIVTIAAQFLRKVDETDSLAPGKHTCCRSQVQQLTQVPTATDLRLLSHASSPRAFVGMRLWASVLGVWCVMYGV
jgi:hypothetical protein